MSEKQGEIKSKSANSFIEFDQNRMAEFGTVNAEAKQRPLVTSEEQLAKRRLKKDGQMQPTIPLQRSMSNSRPHFLSRLLLHSYFFTTRRGVMVIYFSLIAAKR